MKFFLNNPVLLFVFLFIGLQASVSAQPFDRAPSVSKKRVKQIIEWVRPDLKQKSQEGMCSDFDPQGNLIAYYDRSKKPFKKMTLQYNKKGQLLEKTEQHDEAEWKAVYAYQSDRTVEEIKFRGKTTKTFYFLNKKNQLIEKKTFNKGLELGAEFVLKEQVFYYYNKRDSLQSLKIVNYDMISGGKSKKFESRKILHTYSPKSGMRTKSVEYDFDGSVLKEDFYEYDSAKRLIRKLSHFKVENTISTVKYQYQKDQIWQVTSERPGYKDVQIYVDGRLIRLRSYNEEKLYRVVDYQYVYY